MVVRDDPWLLRPARGAEVAEAQALEHDVFVAEGFCERSDWRAVEAYEHLNAQSTWYVAHSDDRVVGVLRIMDAGPETVPALAHFAVTGQERRHLEREHFQEVGTLAVDTQHRGTDVALHLYSEAFCAAVRDGVTTWVAVVEEWLLQHLQGLGFPFRQVGPSRDYMGGECLPAAMSFSEARATLRAKDAAVYEWVTRGIFEDSAS